MAGDNLSVAVNSSGMKSGADFEAVFPAVLQCFTVIGGGYLARKFNLIGCNDLKGIKTLILYFLMPTMIAQAILGVHWDKVNWRFIACVFIAKAFVFVAVAAVTLALSNDLAKAGIYGIFASQSNDMALGCPLIKALYGTSHPEYVDYIYLVMPISLVILNPVGFLMMEIEAQRRVASLEQQRTPSPGSDPGQCVLLRRVFKGIAMNPMIISAVIGLVGSLCLGRGRVPGVVNTVLDGFSSGFVTVALFALGCTLVSGGKPDAHYPLGTALLLSLGKILLLPLILREIVSLTNIGRTENDVSSLAIFGFLYGSLPTAPTVFVFACQYNVAVKQISTALALVTLLSAPWVYLSSKMISISRIDEAEYDVVFSITEFNVAIVGSVCAIFCVVVYMATSKIRRVPHVIVCDLLICSLIACSGVLIGESKEDRSRFIWRRMLVRTLVLWGELSLRLFAVFLALSMTILRSVGLCLVLRLRSATAMIGFCVPLFVALSVVLSAEVAHSGGVSSSEFDVISAYITDVFVTLCLIANVLLLICQYKCSRISIGCIHHSSSSSSEETNTDRDLVRNRSEQRRSASAAYDNQIPDIEDSVVTCEERRPCDGVTRPPDLGEIHDSENDAIDKLRLLDSGEGESTSRPSTSGNVRPMCPAGGSCSSEQRYKCKRLLRQYMKRTRPVTARSVSLEPPEVMENDFDDQLASSPEVDVYEITKHSFLVAFLCISMTVSLFVALWQSVRKDQEGGTYLQLRLLDTVFLYGQPVVTLILFGLDGTWLINLRRRLRRMVYGSEKLILPSLTNIDRPTKAVCEQFARYHLSQCAREIAKNKRTTLSLHENVFRGIDFVDWLLKNGIADGRAAAVKYGRRLVLGRVIEHIDQEEHFYDSSTLCYRFVTGSASSQALESHSC